MIPHDMKDIKMKIIKQGTNQVIPSHHHPCLISHKHTFHQEVLIEDDSCFINEELNWKARSTDTMETEVIMNPTVQRCSLEVSPF